MQESLPHFVTGATGFVGGALVLELLRRTDQPVVVLARAASGPGGVEPAEKRFATSLARAHAAYGSDLPLADVLQRCRVVEGSLASSEQELADRIGQAGQVWHAAASLRYENRYVADIRETNVGGTERMLRLASRVGAHTFNYVSTAYVAGRAAGRIDERMLDTSDTNNHYERSKVDAEALVAAAPHLRHRIFRPSIVVGHSETDQATAFSGFYGFLRQLVQFRGMVERTQAGLLQRTSLKIRADSDLLLDLVAVDVVAEQMARVGLADAAGVFHLTNERPPRVTDVIRTLFAILELREPEFVSDSAELDFISSRFDQRLDFYGSYLIGVKRFDRRRTDAVLGPDREPHVEYDDARLRRLARPYLDELLAARTRLPVSR